jgi:hypothetical protein
MTYKISLRSTGGTRTVAVGCNTRAEVIVGLTDQSGCRGGHIGKLTAVFAQYVALRPFLQELRQLLRPVNVLVFAVVIPTGLVA